MSSLTPESYLLLAVLLLLQYLVFRPKKASLPFGIGQDPEPDAQGIKRSNARAWYVALVAVPLFVGLQYLWPLMIRSVFGSASADVAANSGVIIKPFFGLFQAIIALTGAFLLVRWKFPSIDQYISTSTFAEDFKELSPWQRITAVSFWLGLLSLLAVWGAGTI